MVGSGISGLVVAHGAHRRHDLTVFEAGDRIGGHTRTVPVRTEAGVHPVDTGFIVYNEKNYPAFSRLLRELGVATQPSDMSFSVSCERSGLEYGTRSLGALLARRRNALSPAFHRMVRDIPRFHREAAHLLAHPDAKVSLGEWLLAGRYSDEFVDHHLVPMGAAIWSADPVRLLDFPALRLFRFFDNHGLLQIGAPLPWRVIRGGSARYVDALVAPFRDRIRLRCPARGIRRLGREVEVLLRDGSTERFDHVVLATHSDQALALLADPSDAERRILGAIRYQPNEVVLHTDASLLPRRRAAWASWNVRLPSRPRGRVTLTYHMNRLQSLASPDPLCVTLNDSERIDPERIVDRWETSHPVFDAAAVQAQGLHSHISGIRRTHYCGAYWGYGFHEDGVQSGRRVLRRLGLEP